MNVGVCLWLGVVPHGCGVCVCVHGLGTGQVVWCVHCVCVGGGDMCVERLGVWGACMRVFRCPSLPLLQCVCVGVCGWCLCECGWMGLWLTMVLVCVRGGLWLGVELV